MPNRPKLKERMGLSVTGLPTAAITVIDLTRGCVCSQIRPKNAKCSLVHAPACVVRPTSVVGFGSFASLSPRATRFRPHRTSRHNRAVRGQSEPTVLSVTSAPRMTTVAAAHVHCRVPSDVHHSATMHPGCRSRTRADGTASGKQGIFSYDNMLGEPIQRLRQGY
jgi:hypothetical protein